MESNYDIKNLIKRYRDGDKKAKDIIVENNVRLVWSVVKRFEGRRAEKEDLFQVGCIGLIKAIHKFDFNYEVQFSTYAVPLIIGEIKRFLRDDGMIKVSRALKELNIKIIREREIFIRKSGREPGVSELSEKLDVSAEEVIAAIESSREHESLFSPVAGAGNKANQEILLIDKISEMKTNGDGEVDSEEALNKIMIADSLKVLEEREKQVIFLRYYRGKTQSQISRLLGISQAHVSRVEHKALKQIKNNLEADKSG